MLKGITQINKRQGFCAAKLLHFGIPPKCPTASWLRRLTEALSVGHSLRMRGCPTKKCPTRAVKGVRVGHFGGTNTLSRDYVFVEGLANSAGTGVEFLDHSFYTLTKAGLVEIYCKDVLAAVELLKA